VLEDDVYINILHNERDMKWNAEWCVVLRWCDIPWNKKNYLAVSEEHIIRYPVLPKRNRKFVQKWY